MSGGNAASLERLHELLADRATEGLPREHDDELARLLRDLPAEDEESLDRAAAAVDLPLIVREMTPMPPSLRARIEVDAVAWLARSKGLTVVGAGEAAAAGAAPAGSAAPAFPAWIPWLLAAACILLAVTAWWPVGAVDLAAARDDLLGDSQTTLVAWQDPLELGVSGDVAWNERTQSGFMRFRGLAANDPKAMQYQLWIFDSARKAYSENTAVDGGVFDVDRATGEVIVPIRAKLRVADPGLFAVTTEPPGGVIKHNPERDPERYRIILTAPL